MPFTIDFPTPPGTPPVPLGGASVNNPPGLNILTQQRDQGSWTDFKDMSAHHGPNGEAPGHDGSTQHLVTDYEDSVYTTAFHVMTATGSPGYGAQFLTLGALMDFSQGPATLRWKMSMWRTSTRDWVTVDLTPLDDLISFPLTWNVPDGNGFQHNGFNLDRVNFAWNWTCRQFHDGLTTNMYYSNENRPWEYGLDTSDPSAENYGPSAQNRIQHELILDPGYGPGSIGTPHIELWRAGVNVYYRNIPVALTYTSVVVQFTHHSYSPDKGAKTHWNPPLDGSPNTWHFSDFEIDPFLPLTLIGCNERHISGTGTVTWNEPAPAGSVLHFVALGDVTVDGTVSPPLWGPNQTGHLSSQHAAHRANIPEGATSAVVTTIGSPSRAHGFYIVAPDAGTPPPQEDIVTDSMTPSTLPTDPTTVTLGGAGYTNADTVRITGGPSAVSIDVTDFSIVSDTQITFTSPALPESDEAGDPPYHVEVLFASDPGVDFTVDDIWTEEVVTRQYRNGQLDSETTTGVYSIPDPA